jgi:hypothetical protein
MIMIYLNFLLAGTIVIYGIRIFQIGRDIARLERRLGPETEDLGVFGTHAKKDLHE